MTLDPNIVYLIGVVVSIIVEVIKRYAGTNKLATLGIVLIVSLVGASGYYYVSKTSFFPELLGILTVAGAFYGLIIRNVLPPAQN